MIITLITILLIILLAVWLNERYLISQRFCPNCKRWMSKKDSDMEITPTSITIYFKCGKCNRIKPVKHFKWS